MFTVVTMMFKILLIIITEWVNPLIMFNGNRITYANEYILDEAGER